jgi:putative endonuclease
MVVIPANAGIQPSRRHAPADSTAVRRRSLPTSSIRLIAWQPAGAQAMVMRTSERQFHVYILSSSRHGTLYTGVTSNLVKRIYEHRHDVVTGFTQRYGVRRLVWFEPHACAQSAIAREKQIKHWNRAWKIALIARDNPRWRDRYDEIVG